MVHLIIGGSWTIVVVYGNQLQNMKQLTVFDGLANVSGSNVVNVPVSGFLTPPTGPVNFELGTYVHDGDRGLTGDQMLFSGNGGPLLIFLMLRILQAMYLIALYLIMALQHHIENHF
ncbi:MAG: hypothetical protein NTZ59_06615 [Bacteroidetes bacterium]|nr:hypothetical protein [Bacteroidota bacterium]